jgi:hypothetical protein
MGQFALFDQVLSQAASRGITFSKQPQAMMLKPAGKVPLESFEEAIAELVGANK